MTAITRQVVDAVYCDTFDCLNMIVPPFDESACYDRLPGLLNNRGWTSWNGRGGLHHYCPKHKPRKGHNMTQVQPPSDRAVR